ncbi:MAG: hypothetical protein Q7R69_02575 [bacterium]|nr:hypothetical protein [bacterium]
MNIVKKLLILDYILALGVVIWLSLSNITSSVVIDLYGVLFLGLIPMLGGITGLIIAKQWGAFRSAVGRAIIFLSLGLISWGLGTYIFSGVYNFLLQVEVPYPSLADVGYILSLPLWVIGIIQLSRATGAKYGLRSFNGKLVFLTIPVIVILLSYYLLVVVARGGHIDLSNSGILKIFFDLAYPVSDVIILTLATLIYGLSFNYFGGVYKKAVYFMLAGFLIMYCADFLFSYTTTLGTWRPANWVDLLFTTAVFILSMGVVMFDQRKVSSAN